MLVTVQFEMSEGGEVCGVIVSVPSAGSGEKPKLMTTHDVTDITEKHERYKYLSGKYLKCAITDHDCHAIGIKSDL